MSLEVVFYPSMVSPHKNPFHPLSMDLVDSFLHNISNWARWGYSWRSSHLTRQGPINPTNLSCNISVNTGNVFLSTANSPGNNSNLNFVPFESQMKTYHSTNILNLCELALCKRCNHRRLYHRVIVTIFGRFSFIVDKFMFGLLLQVEILSS